MANLRRHLNFNTKSPTLRIQTGTNPEMASTIEINACNLMNNIQRCLDVCPSYIQALNSFCGAGSLLARNLLHTFQNVPAYHHVSQQFSSIWDEIAEATGSASAAVKTDTLIKLQNVLEVLEAGSQDSSVDVNLVDTFQVIGSCLFSFVELQAQFSLSMWKSLSKLSKNFSHDSFMNPLNWKSHDRNILKMSRNSELSTTIKKHFSHLVHKYEIQKPCGLSNETHSQLYVIPAVLKESTKAATQNEVDVTPKNIYSSVVWSPATTLWSNSVGNDDTAPCSGIIPKNTSSVAASLTSDRNDLDQVINLLSCMPVDQFLSCEPQPSSSQKPYDASFPSPYNFWPAGSGPIFSRHMKNQRLWPDEISDMTFGYHPSIWRTDNINCSSLPNGELEAKKINDLKTSGHTISWENLEFQRWSNGAGENESSSDVSSSQGHDLEKLNQMLTAHLYLPTRQRRYSSSDRLPDPQENMPNHPECFWDIPNPKTSTWPLKQASSKLDWPENLVDSKYMPLYDTSFAS